MLKPAGGLPSEHVIGDVALEQTLAVEVTEHAVANRVLEFVPVGSREVGGLVELDRALGILAEHAVDDTDVEMKVRVEKGAETMKERNSADVGTGSRARISERGPNGPQEDTQHSAGDRGVVVQEGSEALRNGEHPLPHGKRRQDMVDEMGGGLDHTARITRRTYSPAPAGERHQKVVATTGAPGSCESMSENAATQIGPEVSLDP